MINFLKENKVIFTVLVGILIVGSLIYFLFSDKEKYFQILPSQKIFPQCANLPELPDGVMKLVTKIIDGDTFLIEGGYSIRILGIDADERNYLCYNAAKNRLEELILNKKVKLVKGKEDKDQYCRYLRYVFVDDKNISLELVKEGLVVARFSSLDTQYQDEIALAEIQARENKIGCKWAETVVEKNIKFILKWENLTPEKTGLKIIDACQAQNYYNQEVIIEGKVADGYRSKTNTVFLNFEQPYPNQCFTAVIFKSDQHKFVDLPEKFYDGKTVRIKGVIKKYQGKPEIILKDPSQIEIGKSTTY